MTDEIGTDAHLMKRLLSTTPTPVECLVAAARIEALIAERDALFRRATLAEEWRDHDKTRAEEAEAKLAENEVRLRKAVEALEKLARLGNGDRCGNSDGNMIARATLAEIKGESHE